MYIILQYAPEFKMNALCNYLHILAIKLNKSLGNFQIAFCKSKLYLRLLCLNFIFFIYLFFIISIEIYLNSK